MTINVPPFLSAKKSRTPFSPRAHNFVFLDSSCTYLLTPCPATGGGAFLWWKCRCVPVLVPVPVVNGELLGAGGFWRSARDPSFPAASGPLRSGRLNLHKAVRACLPHVGRVYRASAKLAKTESHQNCAAPKIVFANRILDHLKFLFSPPWIKFGWLNNLSCYMAKFPY